MKHNHEDTSTHLQESISKLSDLEARFRRTYDNLTVFQATKLGLLSLIQGKFTELDALNSIDDRGNTVLIVAAEHNRTDVVSYLLKNNVNVHYVKNEGVTALSVAANNEHVACVEILIENGAIIDDKSLTDQGRGAIESARMNVLNRNSVINSRQAEGNRVSSEASDVKENKSELCALKASVTSHVAMSQRRQKEQQDDSQLREQQDAQMHDNSV